MKLLAVVVIYSLSQAGISSGAKPDFDKSREPASIGDATIQEKENFRVEAFGESRAKEHKKVGVKKTEVKKSK